MLPIRFPSRENRPRWAGVPPVIVLQGNLRYWFYQHLPRLGLLYRSATLDPDIQTWVPLADFPHVPTDLTCPTIGWAVGDIRYLRNVPLASLAEITRNMGLPLTVAGKINVIADWQVI